MDFRLGIRQVLAFVPGRVFHPDGAIRPQLDAAFSDERREGGLDQMLLLVDTCTERVGVIVVFDRNRHEGEDGAGVVVVATFVFLVGRHEVHAHRRLADLARAIRGHHGFMDTVPIETVAPEFGKRSRVDVDHLLGRETGDWPEPARKGHQVRLEELEDGPVVFRADPQGGHDRMGPQFVCVVDDAAVFVVGDHAHDLERKVPSPALFDQVTESGAATVGRSRSENENALFHGCIPV